MPKGKSGKHASPHLICFFLLAGHLLTLEINIWCLLFTHQLWSDCCCSSHVTLWFSFLLLFLLPSFCFPPILPKFLFLSPFLFSSQHQDCLGQVLVEEYPTWEVQSTAKHRWVTFCSVVGLLDQGLRLSAHKRKWFQFTLAWPFLQLPINV